MTGTPSSLLIGMGARFHRAPDGALMIEPQTASGLMGWRRSFDRVIGFAIESDLPPPAHWFKILAGLKRKEHGLPLHLALNT